MDKRFALFAGERWESHGGWRDYQGRFATLDAARAFLVTVQWKAWWQIVDLSSGEIVDEQG